MIEADDVLVGIDVKRLRIAPGDILVLRCDEEPKPDWCAAVKAGLDLILARAGHSQVSVLILGPGQALEVVGHAEVIH